MSLALKASRFGSQGGLSGNVQSGGFFDILKGVGRSIVGSLPGGSTALNLVRGITSGGGGRSQLPAIGPPISFTQGVRRAGQALVPGGRTGFEGLKVACESGFHANRSSYFLTDGTFIEKGSRCVKNRRRNPMNPRALDRAIRRVDSGKRLQHKLSEITTAKFSSSGKRK